MPQNNVLSGWRTRYPILAPAQKPPGFTISTTLPANAVPNKPQPGVPTIQAAETRED
jgi:hypothetical protein